MGECIAAKSHFEVWWALRNRALPDYYSTMDDGNYVDFFIATSAAHYKCHFVSIGKIFDRDDRTVGVSRLKDNLKSEGRNDLVALIDDNLSKYNELISKLITIRSKSIAHNEFGLKVEDIYDKNDVKPNDIRALIEETSSTINELGNEYGISNVVFEKGRLEKATLNMLKTLKNGHT